MGNPSDSTVAGKHVFFLLGELSFDSSSCGTQDKARQTVTNVEVGSRQKQSRGLICQEYILQSDHMIFRIRQKDEKHPLLLPIGEVAQFRIGKQKLMVRVPEMSNKEHAYIVVSFTPREDSNSAANAKEAQREATPKPQAGTKAWAAASPGSIPPAGESPFDLTPGLSQCK